jgi:signal transduction histidine kinase
MINRKKPVTRLTVIFISVVIASGSILAYLSINNISNLKELTEKRVLEEQRNLAVAISANIQVEINTLEDMFPDSLSNFDKEIITAIKLFDTLYLVRNSFIINRNGKFIWPWFMDGLESRPEKVPSAGFRMNFDRAERSEFIELDFQKAHQNYHASFKESSGAFDSVKSLNALARLSVKMGDRAGALNYYSTLISKYSSFLDKYGFPYVYYAIPQLIRISDPSNKKMILQGIEYCISRMESGDIPLNQSSDHLLTQVSDWMDGQEIKNDRSVEINKLIKRIKTRLAFIERNAELIRKSLEKVKQGENPLVTHDYVFSNGIFSDPDELILINLDTGYPAGFTVALDQLWNKIIGKGLTDVTEFAYEAKLIKKVNGVNSSENRLSTLADISPYFPGHQILIKLKDEGLINRFVTRRSWIYGISLALLLGGMILGVLLILRDISREEHLARLRSDFVSNVTHELKTPLTSVQLFTESIILDRINSEADKKEYLRIILKETESLKRMINNILEFSKTEKGKLEYKFEQVNVTDLVNMAINDLDYWLVEKGFTLKTQIEDDVIASADQDALKQAIINLLSNAIKFSRNRKEIFVGLRKENGEIRIEVEDKGIGISEDQRDLIFEAFYRVGQKDAEDISGTGLGLTVVKEIIEALHGRIFVESKLNEGSTFTIILNSNQEKTG